MYLLFTCDFVLSTFVPHCSRVRLLFGAHFSPWQLPASLTAVLLSPYVFTCTIVLHQGELSSSLFGQRHEEYRQVRALLASMYFMRFLTNRLIFKSMAGVCTFFSLLSTALACWWRNKLVIAGTTPHCFALEPIICLRVGWYFVSGQRWCLDFG